MLLYCLAFPHFNSWLLISNAQSLSYSRFKMLSRLFRTHGQLCASKPWEVIIGTITLTICVSSMSLYAVSDKICGWNYICEESKVVLSIQLLIIIILIFH